MKQLGKIDVHGLSIRGAGHTRNQDHFAIAALEKSMRVLQTNLSLDDDSHVHGHNQGHLFLVADGISEAPFPARASRWAVDHTVQYFLNEMPWYHLADGEPDDVALALEDALRNCQDELRRGPSPGARDMGATMTLAFVWWPHLYLAHVGENRCYLKRNGEVRQLTRDQARGNAVGGPEEEIRPEVRHVTLQSGDVLALLTDGVARGNGEPELEHALDANASAEDICLRLVAGPSRDDRTAIAVRFLHPEPTLAPVAEAGTPPELLALETPEAPWAPGGRREHDPRETFRSGRPVVREPRPPGSPGRLRCSRSG